MERKIHTLNNLNLTRGVFSSRPPSRADAVAHRSSPLSKWITDAAKTAPILTLIGWVALLPSVHAETSGVLRDYQAQLVRQGSPSARDNSASHAAGSRVTQPKTFVFLVDGLGIPALQQGLRQNLLPHLRSLFLATPGSKISVGHAAFPTLTFPNVAGILTGGAPAQSGVLGNSIWKPAPHSDEVMNFESLTARDTLNRSLEDLTVFSRLSAQRLNSVSFDHFLYAGATARYDLDAESGIAYRSGNYDHIDARLGSSFKEFLSEQRPEAWPRLTFVHWMSYDAFAHQKGPYSAEALSSLRLLDFQLGKFKEEVDRAIRAGVPIQVVLTSDHGFDVTKAALDIRAVAETLATDLDLLVQDRVSFLRWKKEIPHSTKLSTYSNLIALPGVDVLAWRDGLEIQILQQKGVRENAPLALRLKLWPKACPVDPVYLGMAISEGTVGSIQCLSDLERAEAPLALQSSHPYLKTLLAQFFSSSEAPEAILTSAAGVNFLRPRESASTMGRGHHGGLTSSEVLVPMLEFSSRAESLVRANAGRPWPLLASCGLLTSLKDISIPAHAPQSPLSATPSGRTGRPLIQGQYGDLTPDAKTPRLSSEQNLRTGFFARLADSGHELLLNTSPAFLATQLGNRALLISPFTANLDADWRIYWNPRLSTHLSAGVRFPMMSTWGSPLSDSRMEVAPKAAIGLGLTLGYRHQLWFDLGVQRRFLDLQTSLLWPEFETQIQSRWLSLGIGDLVTVGGLGLIAPLSWTGPNGASGGASLGLSQRAELALQRYARERDTITFGLNFIHRIQNIRHVQTPQQTASASTAAGAESEVLRDYEVGVFLRYGISP
jgi:hypothetical protein